MTTDTRCAAYALFTQANHILLGRRKNTGRADGFLSPPCGMVEEGESVQKGMIREIWEEVGVKVGLDDLDLAHYRNRGSGWSKHQFYFHVTGWDGPIVNGEPHLCEGWDWYPMNDLPRDLVPRTAHVIGLWNRGVRYSEESW